jgi:hypothetical protein
MPDVKIEGADGVLALLRALPREVAAKNGGPVRKALRKGALVILKQAQSNLAISTAASDASGMFAGAAGSTGLLAKALTVTRGKAPASGNGERYIVRVLRKMYPDRSGKPVSTRATATWLEYGQPDQPAEPWLRPAFSAKAGEAISVTTTALVKDVEALARKHLRGGAK